MRQTVPSVPPPQQRHHEPIQRSTSITVYKQPHLTTIHSSALSSLRKVFITESARNKLSSSHHALNSLLFALDGYPTATEDPAEIEETARTETVGGGDTGSGRERRDWVPLTGDPLFPSGRLYFSHTKASLPIPPYYSTSGTPICRSFLSIFGLCKSTTNLYYHHQVN